jgi:hypothetical protein
LTFPFKPGFDLTHVSDPGQARAGDQKWLVQSERRVTEGSR